MRGGERPRSKRISEKRRKSNEAARRVVIIDAAVEVRKNFSAPQRIKK